MRMKNRSKSLDTDHESDKISLKDIAALKPEQLKNAAANDREEKNEKTSFMKYATFSRAALKVMKKHLSAAAAAENTPSLVLKSRNLDTIRLVYEESDVRETSNLNRLIRKTPEPSPAQPASTLRAERSPEPSMRIEVLRQTSAPNFSERSPYAANERTNPEFILHEFPLHAAIKNRRVATEALEKPSETCLPSSPADGGRKATGFGADQSDVYIQYGIGKLISGNAGKRPAGSKAIEAMMSPPAGLNLS